MYDGGVLSCSFAPAKLDAMEERTFVCGPKMPISYRACARPCVGRRWKRAHKGPSSGPPQGPSRRRNRKKRGRWSHAPRQIRPPPDRDLFSAIGQLRRLGPGVPATAAMGRKPTISPIRASPTPLRDEQRHMAPSHRLTAGSSGEGQEAGGHLQGNVSD